MVKEKLEQVFNSDDLLYLHVDNEGNIIDGSFHDNQMEAIEHGQKFGIARTFCFCFCGFTEKENEENKSYFSLVSPDFDRAWIPIDVTLDLTNPENEESPQVSMDFHSNGKVYIEIDKVTYDVAMPPALRMAAQIELDEESGLDLNGYC